MRAAEQAGQVTLYEKKDPSADIVHRFRFINQVPLNASNAELLVNFIEYWEISGDTVQHFCWVTDLRVTKRTVYPLMRGGRARWKIANETFNTLKNQGYNFEHNYGHGQKNLSVVFAMLMMLAFLVDQTQQRCCTLFQAVWAKMGSKRMLWNGCGPCSMKTSLSPCENCSKPCFTAARSPDRSLRVMLLHPNLFPLRQRSTDQAAPPRREEATPRSCHDPIRNEPSCHF